MVIESDTLPANPINDFEEFFKEFEESPNVFKYRQKISEAYSKSENFVTVLFEDILNFKPMLANYLKNHPEQALHDAVDAFKNIIRIDAGGLFNPNEEYWVRIATANNSNDVHLRKIRSAHIDKLIYVKGIIIRASDVRPQITQAVFECPLCGNIMQEDQISRKLTPPNLCSNPNCKNNRNFRVITDESVFIDYQLITIQESPDELRSGDIPKTLQAILYHDLVDSVRPGERIKIMGILKSNPKEDRRGRLSTIFMIQLIANSIEGLTQEDEEIELTQDDVDQIHALSQEPFIQKKIARSIARTILGQQQLKMAAAMSLFGGIQKKKKDGSKLRGDIHVLFLGDPGTGKSQILQSCAMISKRSVYTSGKGSSAAGLTAAVLRESDNSGMQLEAGALVLASGGIACIDEFDKMRKTDRVAIHEAMEQQSYHPDFEITFIDKNSAPIGKIVDGLFKKYPKRKIDGINCEILSISDLNYTILTTDFKNTFKTNVNRVSRHKAPNKFIKILYSNGREILVTPEHPIYVFQEGKITTLEAGNLNKKMYVPAVNEIKYEREQELDLNVEKGTKSVLLPSKIDFHLARFLGYFVSEGYSHYGSSAEIGLSNTDPLILAKMTESIEKSFGIIPIDNVENNRSLRVISKTIFNFMKKNFDELMKLSIEKRIPSQIFGISNKLKETFLEAAYEGDGSVESTSIAFSTSSKLLAYDYQDLLLSLNIHSRITKSLYNYGKEGEFQRYRYKVYITGDSLQDFADRIIPENLKSDKLEIMLGKSRKTNRKHDVFPTSISDKIIKCLKLLGIPYDGYLNQHKENNYGVNKSIIFSYLEQFQSRITEIKEKLQITNKLRNIRESVNYSQDRLAVLIEETRGSIDYAENNGYDEIKRENLCFKAKEKIINEIEKAILEIKEIQRLGKFRWLHIKDVEILDNSGENKVDWVYDVTIEPTRNFVCHGLILHNTISIAKGGIVATLQAKTAIIAAANPKYGRWNEYETAVENINLSPPILSRFDLIFVIRDKPDKHQDDIIAEYILTSHMQGYDDTFSLEEEESGKTPSVTLDFIPMELLKKYIRYCKNNAFPKLTKKTAEKIRKFYVEMRNSNPEGSTAVSIVARTLDGIVRMCEAYAKMALRDVVTEEDVDAVIELVKRYMKDIGFDEETQTFDIDIMMTGRTHSVQDRFNKILSKIKELTLADPAPLEFDDIYDPISTLQGITKEFVQQALKEWVDEGTLYCPSPGHYKLTKRPK